MAYLPGFDYDIFISYAHANNDYPKGWVSDFHTGLQNMLNASMRGVTIWRDNNLDSLTRFNEEIAERVKGAAIFVTLYSGAYRDSEYCRGELQTFHRKAQTESWGLAIKQGNRSRIVNVLLRDESHEKWLPELSGITGRKFHGATGWALNQKSEEFERELQELSDELNLLLLAFKKAIDDAPPKSIDTAPVVTPPDAAPSGNTTAPPAPFTVFLAAASTNLRVPREAVFNSLKNKNIAVCTKTPPPFEAETHDEKVRAELARAQLSVHLLGSASGEDIYDLTDEAGQAIKSYSQRQVELGMEHAAHQLIWLPSDLQLETIEDQRHRQFLTDLESSERPATCRIIREPRSQLTRVILDTIEELQQEPAPEAVAALLNFDAENRREARRLGNFLDEIGMLPIDQPEIGAPEETMKVLGVHIKRVSRLLFVYGREGRHWVRDRVNLLMGMAIASGVKPQVCGVCFVPPCSKAQDGNFRLPYPVPIREFDLAEIPTSQALRQVLEV